MSSSILPPLPSVSATTAKTAAALFTAKDDTKSTFSDLVTAAADAPRDPAPVADKPATPEKAAAPAVDDKAKPADTKTDDKADSTKTEAKPATEATDEDKSDEEKDDTKKLDDLIDTLSALDLNLQTGQPIDPALVDKLNAAAQALAALVGAQTPLNGGTAGVIDPNAKTAAIDPTSQLGQLSAKISELAASMKGTSPQLAEQLDAVAQKLASGEVSGDTLAKLGFTAELKAADPAINQAIAALVNSKTAAAKDTTQPVKTAELKIPEATLLAPTQIAPVKPADLAAPPTVAAAPGEETTVAVKQDKAKDDVRAASDDMAKATADVGKDSRATDGATPIGNTARPEVPATTRVVQAAYQGPPSPINLPHMAFEIARQVHAGSNKFQIRLDPADLGRVDVSLDIDKNGTVNARLVVEKTETLDLMQRDQRSLEKALQQAGLDSSKTNLEFSLKQNPSGGQQDNGRQEASGRGGIAAPIQDDTVDAVPTTLYRGTASASGVNIFV